MHIATLLLFFFTSKLYLIAGIPLVLLTFACPVTLFIRIYSHRIQILGVDQSQQKDYSNYEDDADGYLYDQQIVIFMEYAWIWYIHQKVRTVM